MLPLTDWVLELLSMERTPFRAYTVSALLLALLALLFRTLLQLGSSWHRYYVNCQRLRCFPEPPRRNWLLGHLGMGQNTEEGMQYVDELIGRYSHSCLWWFGPWFPILRLFHPEVVKPVLLESGSEGGRSARSLCVCPSVHPTVLGLSKGWIPSRRLELS
ncbi:cytochrome P450 4F22-like isoform X2 [Trachemys scripta elegans]|uniref:cytochrome P450 4F22-like isoform X2 n=1 Tax=Trachemys scripta elegans TaxID=31138 RepID=UPI001554E041|nr:cytochrome P450 4F22-like isoform X2 [Trachemys scripta elegans]